MKNKIHKILGVGLTLVIALALVAGFAVPASAAVEKLNEWYKFDYPVTDPDTDVAGDFFYSPDIDGMREIRQAINGDLYVYADIDDADVGGPGDHEILKSTDGGRTWELTKYSDEVDGINTDRNPGRVYDMVCSSIDADIVYVTDGCYVYKTDDGGDTWSYVAKDSLEEALVGECGYDICSYSPYWRIITCIDVAYDDDDNPFVFIGTRAHSGVNVGAPYFGSYPGSVFWIGEAGYPATWTDLRLECYSTGDYDAFSIGCAPDWADSKETYVVVSDGSPDETHVIYTIGVTCSWIEFAELLWNCDVINSFGIWAASRIGFPDDWEDTETLFVGVVDDDPCGHGIGDPPYLGGEGGDVYMVTDGSAIDMNVAGITTGCLGIDPVDIISLDVMGDTDEASLIAGSYCSPYVYYSYDGGWEWDRCEKEPTGEQYTYVIWYGDSALAATWGDESAVSLSCGEEVGEFWNQISLIATDIDCVRWLDHSPGYLTESETMFMLTGSDDSASFPYQPDPDPMDGFHRGYDYTQSLFRHDGTYWERVYCSVIAGSDLYGSTPEQSIFLWVHVSPDFNTTEAVFLANKDFEIWRTLDAGCSWDKLTFPCAPREKIGALVVIDEDTVIAGGQGSADRGKIFKTTRHGARPWDEYEATDARDAKSFALEPGYEDPGTILFGTEAHQVYISEDGGEEWDLVGTGTTTGCEAVLGRGDAHVAFDPGYGTNNTIYAAAGDIIARCIIDPDEDMADQEWEVICAALNEAAGIAAAGDTALYVTDRDVVSLATPDTTNYCVAGGVLRSLNPLVDLDEEDVVFERIGPGLEETDDGDVKLNLLWLTTDVSDEGCAENVLWAIDIYNLPCGYRWAGGPDVWVYEDTLAAPVALDMPIEGKFLATTTEATLSWKELCGADCYEVTLWSYCAECPDEKLEVVLDLDCCPEDLAVACGGPVTCPDDEPCTEEICIVVDGLDPGTTYYWQVRVCTGKPTLSKWSVERTFTTAMETVPWVMCSPECGAEDVILTPNFSWESVEGATGYDIELAPTETFTTGVIRGESTVNAWAADTTLEYGTTYYWRVRAEKDGILSDWTVCLFTTMEEAVPPPPPVEITPAPAAPEITVLPPPVEEIAPNWIWAIIGIGAALVVVVIVLIVRTRRPPA